ncbi:MAG: LPS assembly protein LptD [Bryobacteraceae bacterium]|nr:LPS assembly protein LptD [Bryobacteraceae bacterium]
MLIAVAPAWAQFNPRQYSLPAAPPVPLEPSQRILRQRPNAPGANDIVVRAVNQEVQGNKRLLRGSVELETSDLLLKADEIDYDTDSGAAEARGHVYYENFNTGEVLDCDRAEYNIEAQEGKFYNVRGSSPAKIDARPGILSTSNPFIFQGRWAERVKQRYILYDGFITSCKLPRPWWRLTGPKFDIIPGERAIAQRSFFKVGNVPVFYFPYFFKSLAKEPRRSGFLTPRFGTSSRLGFVYGFGYFWAINRSYDLLYNGTYFTQRGLAHTVDFRGKPNEKSDFNVNIWGINDRGRLLGDGVTRIKEGGYNLTFTGRAELGRGWHARGQINYLSSLVFRRAFTQTFTEAIASEVKSIGILDKHWSSFSINAIFAQLENFQSDAPGDKVAIRRLPQVEFIVRERPVFKRELPVWISLESTGGLVRRNQPLFQTRAFVERFDVNPRVSTRMRWKEIALVPSFAVRGTYWGSSQPNQTTQVTGQNQTRLASDIGLDLILPSFSKVFNAPSWAGVKMKHVIEPRASFRAVSGVADFNRTIRFDEIELLNNTREAEISLANRFFVKNKAGVVSEFLSWTVWQRRYFDPTFGGAIVDGRRNVLESQIGLTSFSFLGGPRHYSPVVSSLRMNPIPSLGIEWRTDYDPLRGQITNSTFAANGRINEIFLSAGHNQVRNSPISPPANQFTGLIGLGRENRRGWNAGFNAIYDYRLRQLQFSNSQLTYNSDCCGFSFQFRRLEYGPIQYNQYRFAFVIANIGSVGNLRRQERFF